MRILLNTPPLDKSGGVASFFLNLRSHLPENVEYFPIGRREGEPCWLIPFRMLLDYYRFFLILWRKPVDLVHLNPSMGPLAVWRDGLFILIAKAFGKTIIIFFHGWDKTYEGRMRKYGMWLFRLVYLRVNAFIVLADAFRTSLRSMGYAGPIEIMTTVSDSDLLSKVGYYPSRTDVGEPFHILFLSRIERTKGVFESLQAFEILQSKHSNAHMTIAGIGAALDETRGYVSARNLSNVRFAGYVRGDLKAEEFNRAHCYLFPSYTEGMPISVVEAMSFGLPVVTRSVGALVDFFVDEEMGFITKSKDPVVFAELLERLMLSPELCNRMSLRNREYALSHFNPERVASRLISLYRLS